MGKRSIIFQHTSHLIVLGLIFLDRIGQFEVDLSNYRAHQTLSTILLVKYSDSQVNEMGIIFNDWLFSPSCIVTELSLKYDEDPNQNAEVITSRKVCILRIHLLF